MVCLHLGVNFTLWSCRFSSRSDTKIGWVLYTSAYYTRRNTVYPWKSILIVDRQWQLLKKDQQKISCRHSNSPLLKFCRPLSRICSILRQWRSTGKPLSVVTAGSKQQTVGSRIWNSVVTAGSKQQTVGSRIWNSVVTAGSKQQTVGSQIWNSVVTADSKQQTVGCHIWNSVLLSPAILIKEA